jgi:hypothetical protein
VSLGNEIDAREYKNSNYFDWLDSRDVISVPANQTLSSSSEHNFFKIRPDVSRLKHTEH